MKTSIQILCKSPGSPWVLEAVATLREFGLSAELTRSRESALVLTGDKALKIVVPQSSKELIACGKKCSGDVFVAVNNGVNAALFVCTLLKPAAVKKYRSEQTARVLETRNLT